MRSQRAVKNKGMLINSLEIAFEKDRMYWLLLTVGHDGFWDLAEVLLVDKLVLWLQKAICFEVCLYLNDIDEANHVNGFG